MLENHLILFGAWVAFYGLHSLLASSKLKSSVSLNSTAYRLIYSLFSTFSLGFVLLLGASISSPLILIPNQATFAIGLLTAAYGIFIIKRSFRNYSFRAFMGFKKESETILKTSGLQGRMRHPLYTGTILLVVGYVLFNPLLTNLISLICLLLYLPLGIRFEEKKLISTFGQEYIDYKESVPSLFPRIRSKSKSE